METGFYWVGRRSAKPQVWFYREASGFFRPLDTHPMTISRFEAEGYLFLSGRLDFNLPSRR